MEGHHKPNNGSETKTVAQYFGELLIGNKFNVSQDLVNQDLDKDFVFLLNNLLYYFDEVTPTGNTRPYESIISLQKTVEDEKGKPHKRTFQFYDAYEDWSEIYDGWEDLDGDLSSIGKIYTGEGKKEEGNPDKYITVIGLFDNKNDNAQDLIRVYLRVPIGLRDTVFRDISSQKINTDTIELTTIELNQNSRYFIIKI